MNTQQLNEFLTNYKIHINFKIAQLTQNDIDKIRSDEIGKDNLLGFDHFSAYKFEYGAIKASFFKNWYQLVFKNGAQINLLNNKISDKIIIANHADYRKSIAQKHEFILTEPAYITSNNITATKPRIKDYSKSKKLHANLEIAKNIDLKVEANKETEEENELDLDKTQEDNKFTINEAIDRSYVLDKSFFKEEYLSNDYSYHHIDLNALIKQIFNSSNKIKFISSKALDLVVKNAHLFTSGIDVENMPIGLAIKKGILFATEQRLSSMPINEFTIKPSPLTAEVSDPLSYSWLIYASKATISLNDIYGSSIAPRITGEEVHPITKHHGISDVMLDIPYNYMYQHYTLDSQENPSYPMSNLNENNKKLDHFLGMNFYNLSADDKKRLEKIKDNLEQRGLLGVFEQIIKTSTINDGGFFT